ncbi:MAG: hypothetical protein RMK20_09065 [Verrucomicrobiales bacterium]|nr:hypothetical protein [Verrucomicrobiales bacterium]
MKTICTVLIAWLAALPLAIAQTDEPAVETRPERVEAPRVELPRAEPKPEPFHQVRTDGVTVSGIAVAAVKADNKLQLLNPVAPEQYGTSEDSVVRDPINGKVTGLKLLAIEF